jgi:hypothetical protein
VGASPNALVEVKLIHLALQPLPVEAIKPSALMVRNSQLLRVKTQLGEVAWRQ